MNCRLSSGAARTLALVSAVLFVLVYTSALPAADRVWDGGGANDNWTTPANWDGDLSAPIGNDAIFFDVSPRLTPNNNSTADTIYGPITFNAGAGSFIVGGNRITLGGNLVDSSPNAQTINLPLLLNGDRTATVDTGGQLTLNGVIDGATFGLTKAGAGTLTLGANNTYTGNTTVDGGTLIYTANNTGVRALNFGVAPTATAASNTPSAVDLTNASLTATSLTVRTNSATANTINIGAGKSLTVNGGVTIGLAAVFADPLGASANTNLNVTGDSLVVNGAANNFTVGVPRGNAAAGTDPAALLDMSAGPGLSNFTFTGVGTIVVPGSGLPGSGEFQVGGGNVRGMATLANVSNTITASVVRVGDSQAANSGTQDNNPNTGGASALHLGNGTNVFQTNFINIGSGKGAGLVDFAATATAGSISIAGFAGGASTADINIGSAVTGNGATIASSLLLAGHNATVQAGTVIIGRLNGGTGASGQGVVTFDTGTFNATNIHLSVNSSGTNATANSGTLTIGGPTADNLGATGVLNVSGQFFLGNRTNATPGAARATATFTINGGTANINTDIIDASTTVSTAGANITTLTLAGGTLNLSGHHIGTAALPITTVNLNSGTLNDAGNINASTINVLPTAIINGTTTNFVLPSNGTLNSTSGPLTLGTGTGIAGGGSSAISTIPGTVNGDVIANSGSKIAPGSATSPGTINFNGNLTLNNGSAVALSLSDSPSTSDSISVNGGGLTFSGTVNLQIGTLGLGPQLGNTYTLFTYNGAFGGSQSNFNVIAPVTRATYSIVPTASTPGLIQLSVGGDPPLAITWIGNVNSNWDLNATANWRNPSATPDKYFDSDTVTFDNTSTNNNPVSIVGTVSPGGISVAASRDYTFAGTGTIAGGAGLTKSGTGTLIIANNNTYSGATDIQQGTLQIGNGGTTGSVGTGPISIGGTLTVNRTDGTTTAPLVFANTLSGSGNIIHSANAVTAFAGDGAGFFGTVSVNAGSVRINTPTGLGSAIINVAPGASLVGGTAAGPITGTINLNAATLGTTANSVFNGEITVATSSTIRLGEPLNLPTVATDVNDISITGNLHGSGDLTILSNGQDNSADAGNGFRLRGTGLADYSGKITVSNNAKAELQASVNNYSPAGTATIMLTAGAASLGDTLTAPATTGGYTELNVRNNNINGGTEGVTFANNIEVAGTGVTFLNPLGTAPAGSNVTMANLKIGAGQELGVFLNTGTARTIIFPTVQLNGSATFSPKKPGFGAVASVGSDLQLGTVTQLISGSGITMAGLRTLTITGDSTYTGPTNVNSGTLLVNGSHTVGAAYTVASSGTLGGTGTVGSPITVAAGGAISPGAPIGTLNTASVALSGTLRLDIDAITLTQDVLNVAGALSFAQAALNLTITGALTEPSYVLVNYGSLTGNPFLTFTGMPENYTLDYHFGGTNKIALVSAIQLQKGDWDRNGVVNGADISVMLKALTDLKTFQSTRALSDANLVLVGDFDNSSGVTNNDIQPLLDLVATNGFGSVASVPEPSSLFLVGLGAGIVIAQRLRRLKQHEQAAERIDPAKLN